MPLAYALPTVGDKKLSPNSTVITPVGNWTTLSFGIVIMPETKPLILDVNCPPR